MGNYNPHTPRILGQEWAPIKDEDVVFSPAINAVEYGHQFVLTASRTLSFGRFYSTNPPKYTGASGQIWAINVYPTGNEALSGPIQRVVVPCTNATATGGGLTPTGNVTIDLQNPSEINNVILVNGSGGGGQVDMSFGMDFFPNLNGKRILLMNFLTLIVNQNSLLSGDIAGSALAQGPNTTLGLGFVPFGQLPAIGSTQPTSEVSAVSMGDANRMAFSNVPSVVGEFMPWNYTNLVRFVPAAPSGMHMTADFRNIVSTDSYIMNYAALELFYCEETRVSYGCRGFIDFGRNFNQITMRTCPSQTLTPQLDPGRYTVTVATMDPGNYSGGVVRDDPPGTVDGLRELYSLTNQQGVKVSIPFPVNEAVVGKEMTAEQWSVLPQISLHTSGAALTEVHAYGRQVAFPVFGSLTPEQEIYDDALSGATIFDQIRFYARRFGQTSVPLEVFGVSGTAGSANITPADFDALDEIISGWKQVTLTLSPTTTMGALAPPAPRFRFGATGELVGNRWEVLGACAPALSGLPGNPFNLAPLAQQLYEATYQPPGGSQAELTWAPQGIGSPPVTAKSDDDSSDAVLMFAQSLPTITGFSVRSATQTLTGIGLDCGLNPCCIPSALLYNRITWALPVNTGVASDDFNRTVAAGGWGTASDGGVWTVAGTAGNFSVNGSNGIISPSATGTQQVVTHAVSGPDQDIRATIRINGTSEGTGSLRAGVVARFTDASNFYTAELWYTQNSTAELHIRKVVGGVNSDIATVVLLGMNPNTVAYRFIRFQLFGQYLMAKVWGADSDEPDWMIQVTDTSLTTGNNAGAYARDDTTAAAPNSMFFENFSVLPPDYWFGSYELQRMDTVDTDWQTIMKATSPATTGFSDYEARVGILSSYRIRGVDVYDFVGPWSSTVTITIPSPGASGGCISQGHVLLFSTNERQNGSSNLAYSSVWENQVSEDFTFPESSFVQLQAMYNKDFFTAFRPTERGGEQFQRTVLVQAAAISAPTLADFTSLRDMAWDDVSYICVRDEGGNRWFATVLVPSGRVLHNRKLYLAPVQVIEVTDTPSEVDP